MGDHADPKNVRRWVGSWCLTLFISPAHHSLSRMACHGAPVLGQGASGSDRILTVPPKTGMSDCDQTCEQKCPDTQSASEYKWDGERRYSRSHRGESKQWKPSQSNQALV